MRTTLNKIHKHAPQSCCWVAVLNYLGKSAPDDDEIPLYKIYEAVGLLSAIWCLRTIEGAEKEKNEFYEYCFTEATPEEITLKFLEIFGE